MFCNNPSILSTILLVKNILQVLGIGIPILLILLITLDFLKAISRGDGGYGSYF